jgi:hypothetical protein
LAEFCAFADGYCPDRHFDPDHPRREASPTAPTVADAEARALARLPERYDTLATSLARAVDPAKTIIVEYFDPLRGADGKTCTDALPRLHLDESQWAQRYVLAPLNAAAHAAAARHAPTARHPGAAARPHDGTTRPQSTSPNQSPTRPPDTRPGNAHKFVPGEMTSDGARSS